MEIFCAAIVRGAPRSNPKSTKTLNDDDDSPDDPLDADCPTDLADLGTDWHVIARDEPSSGPFQIGDFVEYWHRGEFQIRDPQTKVVLSHRKQIYLRVNGTYPNWTYTKSIDTTQIDIPPSWELAISGPKDGYRALHYPERGISVQRAESTKN